MPVSGAKPKPPGQAVTRHKQIHEWLDVVDAPFDGVVPVKLPSKWVRTLPFGGTEELATHPMAKQWWKTITGMPHCRLWSESDWLFALETAIVANQFFYGQLSAASELARREKVIGTTVDSRRDLRIRYVDATPAEGEGANVTRLDDYRGL
jgi:hypothetical protein